jgi:hypothetical protein
VLALVLQLVRAPVFDMFNNLCRLVAKPLGKLLMPLRHFVVRHVQLRFAGVVGRDLRGCGALASRFGQVVFNLLTTWADRRVVRR